MKGFVMQKKKAFTLVELLVVIAIIALLMGVLLPSLTKAREQARQVKCRHNLRNLVVGALLWSEDHDGWAIATDWWKEPGQNEEESSLLPYLATAKKVKDGVFACPTAANIEFFHVDPMYNTRGNERRYTYAVNGYMTLNLACGSSEGSPGSIGPTDPMTCGSFYGPRNIYWTVHGVTPMIQIRKPVDTVFFIDHEYYCAVSWTFNPLIPLSDFPADYRFKTRWHNIKAGSDYGIGNIGWVDGHVSKEPSDFTSRIGPPDPIKHKDERWRYYFYMH
jgi:prepilin-type N-terminal cleavage/methylation domain-containing protein/prepilin-type processing-associated H-X9-DG protein